MFLSPQGPTLILIKRRVGKPTSAVILLICLFLPSCIRSSIQLVGSFFLVLIGGFLSQSLGSLISFAFAGRVIPSFSKTPVDKALIADEVICPSI